MVRRIATLSRMGVPSQIGREDRRSAPEGARRCPRRIARLPRRPCFRRAEQTEGRDRGALALAPLLPPRQTLIRHVAPAAGAASTRSIAMRSIGSTGQGHFRRSLESNRHAGAPRLPPGRGTLTRDHRNSEFQEPGRWYNRIPHGQAFADLRDAAVALPPARLADGGSRSTASCSNPVVGSELRLFLHRPAGAAAPVQDRKVVDDSECRHNRRRQSAGLHRAYQARFRNCALRPVPRFCGGLATATSLRRAPARPRLRASLNRRSWHAPSCCCSAELAVIDNLSGRLSDRLRQPAEARPISKAKRTGRQAPTASPRHRSGACRPAAWSAIQDRLPEGGQANRTTPPAT